MFSTLCRRSRYCTKTDNVQGPVRSLIQVLLRKVESTVLLPWHLLDTSWTRSGANSEISFPSSQRSNQNSIGVPSSTVMIMDVRKKASITESWMVVLPRIKMDLFCRAISISAGVLYPWAWDPGFPTLPTAVTFVPGSMQPNICLYTTSVLVHRNTFMTFSSALCINGGGLRLIEVYIGTSKRAVLMSFRLPLWFINRPFHIESLSTTLSISGVSADFGSFSKASLTTGGGTSMGS
jgi:hypothetical protein